MMVTLQNVKAEDIVAIFRKYRIKPKQELTLMFEPAEPDQQGPPQFEDYPDDVKDLLKEAEKELKALEKEGYTEEQAFKDFFEVQEEIAEYIKKQKDAEK